MPNGNEARGRVTREHLLRVATRLFSDHGYEATSVEAVLRAAGVSRGSLYHHFPGKDALFRAVLEGVQSGVYRRLEAAAQEAGDPAAALLAGCLAWIDEACDPVVRRIVLLDAPAVLGWQAWRELDQRYALGLLKAGLEAAGAGTDDGVTLDTLAHVLLAALNELALMLAKAPDAAAARADAVAAVRILVNSLTDPDTGPAQKDGATRHDAPAS